MQGIFYGAQYTMDGELLLTFKVDETKSNIEQMNGFEGKDLTITVKQTRNKRSLRANAYFWELVGKIATVVHTDTESIYLMMLERYGEFDYIEVYAQAMGQIKELYRHTVEEYRYEAQTTLEDGSEMYMEMVALRCYIGSSQYDTKQMSRLIDGTVWEAKQLGIETLPPDELAQMVKFWKGAV